MFLNRTTPGADEAEQTDLRDTLVTGAIMSATGMAVSFVVKKGFDAIYSRTHDGKKIPDREDLSAPLTQVLVWALATTTVITVAEVITSRYVKKLVEQRSITR